MRKRRLILVLGCAALATFAAIFVLRRDEGPYYANHSLKYWVDSLGSDPALQANTDPQAAIANIGTNAIPVLVKWLAYDQPQSAFKLRVLSIYDNIPVLNRIKAIRRWALEDAEIYRSFEAVRAFSFLGNDATNAIPALLAIAHSPVVGPPTFRAVDALAAIGQPALPALVGFITNKQCTFREHVVESLNAFGTNAAPAVPVLIESLQDPSTNFVRAVILTLGTLGLEPQLVVPALARTAQVAEAELREQAMISLLMFGEDARLATPVLLKIRESNDMTMRAFATMALERIAPEVLTNAPAQ